MLHLIRFALAALVALGALPTAVAAPMSRTPDSYQDDSHVTVTLQTWMDPKRDHRQVPVTVYYDDRAVTTPRPVIIVSHGLGGSRDAMPYLGRAWAAAGYISVHLQHAGSDSGVWKGKLNPMEDLKAATKNIDNVIQRSGDVQFAIDKLTEINGRPGPFHQGLDLAHIGMAGHSFGAHTTLMIAGQNAELIRKTSPERGLSDPRVSACLALSPAPPQVSTEAALKRAYQGITMPIMHMTGTVDISPIRDVKPADRRVPYDHINNPDQYLVIFKDGDHALFGGRQQTGRNDEQDAAYQKLIIRLSTAYWDAYLRKDARASQWLKDRSTVQTTLGESATFETKAVAEGIEQK